MNHNHFWFVDRVGWVKLSCPGRLSPFLQTIREIRESWDLTRIEGENAAFPDELVQEFKHDIVALAQKSRELSFRLMRSLALALGLDQEYFVEESSQMFTRNSHTKLRSLHYPAIQKDIEPGWIRCGEHTGE